MEALRGNRRLLAAGLGYKLLLAPTLIAILYFGILGLRGQTVQVTLFESAMAPQIGGSIVAIQYGLNASLITLMVGIGTVISFLTLPGWWYFFQ
jgi:predicted permease